MFHHWYCQFTIITTRYRPLSKFIQNSTTNWNRRFYAVRVKWKKRNEEKEGRRENSFIKNVVKHFGRHTQVHARVYLTSGRNVFLQYLSNLTREHSSVNFQLAARRFFSAGHFLNKQFSTGLNKRAIVFVFARVTLVKTNGEKP